MSIILNSLPKDLEEFKLLFENDRSNPENVCLMFLAALNLYTHNKDEGIEAINLLRGPRPMTAHDVQFLRDRLRDKLYLPLAYFKGATVNNNYAPDSPYRIEMTLANNFQEEGFKKVFLKTEGADSPRPITLREKDGNWCIWEYSSILLGIRLPKKDETW